MSLKIPSVDKPLTRFDYAIARFNDSSILITILYNDDSLENATDDKLIVFFAHTDATFKTLDFLAGFLSHFFRDAKEFETKKMTISYDDKRGSYLYFDDSSNEPSKRITGQYYEGNLCEKS